MGISPKKKVICLNKGAHFLSLLKRKKIEFLQIETANFFCFFNRNILGDFSGYVFYIFCKHWQIHWREILWVGAFWKAHNKRVLLFSGYAEMAAQTPKMNKRGHCRASKLRWRGHFSINQKFFLFVIPILKIKFYSSI